MEIELEVRGIAIARAFGDRPPAFVLAGDGLTTAEFALVGDGVFVCVGVTDYEGNAADEAHSIDGGITLEALLDIVRHLVEAPPVEGEAVRE